MGQICGCTFLENLSQVLITSETFLSAKQLFLLLNQGSGNPLAMQATCLRLMVFLIAF